MNDFADWLSPIVVKELRQGMRARAFTGIFLAIQVFMIGWVLVSLEADPKSANGVNGFFWTVVVIAVLLLMPVRGFSTLNSEMKGNTMELMLLTQLSAWRITAGKWLALVLQTLLLVCAVLPYVVLRYFLGGVNLIGDLKVLGWLVAASALLTALSVGLSPYMQSVVGRLVLGLSIPVFVNGLSVAMVMPRPMGSPAISPSASGMFWTAALLGPLLILEVFEIGVGKIAPAAENHGTRKRLLAGALVGVAVILGRALHQPGLLLVLAAIAVAPVALGVLMEDTVEIPSVYRPFVRRKLFGWLSGRFLYPGWASGMLFFVLIAGGLLWSASLDWSSADVRFRVAAGLEAILAPLVLVRLFSRRAKVALPVYFILQVVLFVSALVLLANSNTYSPGHPKPDLTAAGFIPTIGFLLHAWGNNSVVAMVNVAFSVAAFSFLALFILSLKEWQIIATMERKAADLE